MPWGTPMLGRLSAVPWCLSWGCQGSGYTQLLLPFPLGTSHPPTGVQQVSFLTSCLCLLGMPQMAQGSDQLWLLLQESLAVSAQQLLEGCGNAQGGLYKLVPQSLVMSCFGVSWPQSACNAVPCSGISVRGHGQLQCQSWGWVGASLEGSSGPSCALAPPIPVQKLQSTTLVSFQNRTPQYPSLFPLSFSFPGTDS